MMDNQMTAYFRKFKPSDLAGGVMGDVCGVTIFTITDEPNKPVKHIPIEHIEICHIVKVYRYEEIKPTDTVLTEWEHDLPPREIVRKGDKIYWRYIV